MSGTALELDGIVHHKVYIYKAFEFYLYTSSKGLVSEKHESQTSLTTLVACTSSLHLGRAMTDLMALARTQF
jgi:hypothetical protein